ncbi:hypothetical protein Plec18167_004412 [Paecilomyces lecythidis]|uniref:Pyoverdine biosynthesis n=1 Tax=Paecilomyces lecythidis TaxID=3004212 RepID=A0ABR3XRK5_9EURO
MKGAINNGSPTVVTEEGGGSEVKKQDDSLDVVYHPSTDATINMLSEEEVDKMAEKVMDVLATYFWSPDDESGVLRASDWPGRKFFKKHATHWIRRNEPVKMVLPAFPFKSANPEKVSGLLPDFAEFLGLSRLNQMCLDIHKVYEFGAQITLATDGVVFNDLVLVDDNEVWNYGQAIRDMVDANFFHHNIKVVYAMELLGITNEKDPNKELFFATIDQCRDQILAQFTQHEEAMQMLVDEDPDSRLTYTGIKTFCKVDQANSIYRKQAPSRKAFLRDMSSLALKILARSEGFGKLIRARLPNHIRLSIHPSSGAAKLSICLLPQPPGGVSRAPWMSSIAVDRKGNYLSMHSKDVQDTHELIYKDGKPWLFRERCAIYDIQKDHEEEWAMEHMYPTGLLALQIRTSRVQSIIPPLINQKLKEIAAWQPVQIIQSGAYSFAN